MKDNKIVKNKMRLFGIPALFPYIRAYIPLLIMVIVTGFIVSLLDAVFPLFQEYAIDHFVADNTLEGLWIFILLYLLVIVLQTIINYISSFGVCRLEQYVSRDLRNNSFDHLQSLSFSYFNTNSVGYIHARIISDTERISATISWGIMEIVWHGAYIIGAIYFMLRLNFRLALIVLSVVPVMCILSAFFQKKLLKYNRLVREQNSNITSAFNEGINGAETAKTLVIEDKMISEFKEISGKMKRLSVRTSHIRALFLSSTAFAGSVALALVLWRGGIINRQQLILLGTLSVFMNYAQGMIDPIQYLVRGMSQLINCRVNIERFIGLMETESDVSDSPEVIEKYGDIFSPKTENWEKINGDIEFDDVSFCYPDGNEYVLEHFNLKVPRGTNVAIVGETGAGKSTLVNLVCRFFEPTDGRVLIDGKDARERSRFWLHSNLGYVLQSPHLFSGTILENMRYGKPDASIEEIEAALKAVSADEIIARMPEGINSVIGESGNTMSTGEKQLLSFARAILADPAIFVLDEATSSVDTVTEKLLQSAVEKLMKGRTSFVIAHRLSTIRSADIILVISDGKIVEKGNHNELMKNKGTYYHLYTRQYMQEMEYPRTE